MKSKFLRVLALILVSSMLLTAIGCKKVTYVESKYEYSTEKESEDSGGENSTDVTGSEDSAATESNSTSDSAAVASNRSTAGSTPVSMVPVKAVKGKLELQIFANGSDDSKAWEVIIAKFEEINPDLTITARMGVNVNTQLLTRWMSNNPPDFVSLAGAGFPEETIEAAGGLYDMSEWIKTATVYGTNQLITNKLRTGMLTKYKGSKINKVPISWGAYGLWYDSNYFSKNNLTMPYGYEDLLAFGNKANSLGKSLICYPGVYSGYLVWGLVMPAIAAYGSDYFNKVSSASDPSAFTDNRMKEVLQRLANLAAAGNFMQGTVQLNHIESQMEWLNRRSLLIPNGLWLENEMSEDTPSDFKMKFSASSLAKKTQGQFVIPYISNVAVAAKGKNIENALAFVRYLYTDKNMQEICEVTGSIPVVNVDYSKFKYSASAKDAIDYINGKNVKIVYKTGTWGTVDAEFNNVVNALVLGEISVDQACNRLSNACKIKISESK